MNYLLIEREAADRVARLHEQARVFRAGMPHYKTAAKRTASMLRGLAARLDREYGGGHASDLTQPGRLGHQRA